MDKNSTIGMIGIGLMGHGIARNVAKHYPLVVLDHPGNQPLDELQAAGARVMARARDVAAAADVVILCVTGTPQVEAVLLGEGGVLEGLKPGAVVVDCSTAVPSSTDKVAQAVQAAGGRFLDAPMTRTPKEAHEGRLNLLVGGDKALFDECRPLLATFAENITHCGPVGAGHRMKLLHNYVSLGSITLLAEAAACAERSGVAPDVFLDVLTKGGGGGAALERLRPYITARDTSGIRFSISNAHKDLGYYTAMAEEAGAAHLVATAMLATLAQGLAASTPQTLLPEMVSLLAGAQVAKH
ncbi:NAD(P)-dependent oxidoreductase [Paenacidovorax monticola]|uniref:NAD(P)-dependent oxidoreductase n=1 Tax=Paenacidovorax monticola TaxID=1926868 RepID=A0A7H0HET2_9BURK|nr:NAD(P)-dependent oxidoreductase [Paenacidovorax monticola]QNP59048.1 NAD(P)-dependent oxidoreductase [Paenacidovorax monticola]